MEKRGSRIHAVVELVCDQDELLSERVSTKLVRHFKHFAIFSCSFVALFCLSALIPPRSNFFFLLHTSHESQVHAASGRSYNTSFDAPREHGLDDVTGEPLEHSGAAVVLDPLLSCSACTLESF
jgi:hypothetical protein